MLVERAFVQTVIELSRPVSGNYAKVGVRRRSDRKLELDVRELQIDRDMSGKVEEGPSRCDSHHSSVMSSRRDTRVRLNDRSAL